MLLSIDQYMDMQQHFHSIDIYTKTVHYQEAKVKALQKNAVYLIDHGHHSWCQRGVDSVVTQKGGNWQ